MWDNGHKKITNMIFKYVVFFSFSPFCNLNTCYTWILWLKFWIFFEKFVKYHQLFMMCTSINKKCGAKGEKKINSHSKTFTSTCVSISIMSSKYYFFISLHKWRNRYMGSLPIMNHQVITHVPHFCCHFLLHITYNICCNIQATMKV